MSRMNMTRTCLSAPIKNSWLVQSIICHETWCSDADVWLKCKSNFPKVMRLEYHRTNEEHQTCFINYKCYPVGKSGGTSKLQVWKWSEEYFSLILIMFFYFDPAMIVILAAGVTNRKFVARRFSSVLFLIISCVWCSPGALTQHVKALSRLKKKFAFLWSIILLHKLVYF